MGLGRITKKYQMGSLFGMVPQGQVSLMCRVKQSNGDANVQPKALKACVCLTPASGLDTSSDKCERATVWRMLVLCAL